MTEQAGDRDIVSDLGDGCSELGGLSPEQAAVLAVRRPDVACDNLATLSLSARKAVLDTLVVEQSGVYPD